MQKSPRLLAATKKFTIGVGQMTCTHDVTHNLAQCSKMVEQAQKADAKILFLPEACDFIGRDQKETIALAHQHHASLMEAYRNLARKHDIWLSLGGLHVPNSLECSSNDHTRLWNTHYLLDNTGRTVGAYNKMHLFDIDIQQQQSGSAVRVMESAYTRHGQTLVPPITTPWGSVGLATCYDVRFAEQAIWLRDQGAHIIAYPSAFTVTTGQAHWHTLLRCRAIETQCYVMAAAQVGVHNEKRSTFGHALIVDPWGQVLVDCGTQQASTVGFAEIDMEHLNNIRQRLPCAAHRRTNVYAVATRFNKPEIVDDQQFGPHPIVKQHIFLESASSYAFVNLKPVLPGHVLVASKRVAAKLTDLTLSEVSDLFSCVQRVQKMIERCYGTNSSTVSIQDGPDAGQTVKHVHVHILPRKPNDFAQNDDVYKELDRHEKDERAGRTEQEMADEASRYRQLMCDM